jgi:hypothetical protein
VKQFVFHPKIIPFILNLRRIVFWCNCIHFSSLYYNSNYVQNYKL